MVLAGKAESTVKIYLAHVASLAEHYRTSPELLSEEQVRKFLVQRKQVLELNSMRPLVGALKFFFTQTVPRDWKTLRGLRIPKVRKLPTVLVPEKVWQFLDATEELHWQCFFRTSYTSGLRPGDTRYLTVHDVDAERMQIHVRKTKNSNERFVPLAESTLYLLREYWQQHRHPCWLFPSRAKPKQLDQAMAPVSARSVQRAFQQVVQSLGWDAPGLRPHTLRHSYATAMLEAGVSLRVLQSYLGHRNLQATEIYLHLTRDSDASARKIVRRLMNGPGDAQADAADAADGGGAVLQDGELQR